MTGPMGVVLRRASASASGAAMSQILSRRPPSSSRRLNALGFLAAAGLVAGVALAWLRWLPAMAGFALFALGGLGAILVALLSVVQALRGRGFGRGAVVATVVAVGFVFVAARGSGPPPINDFTTDLADPPAFRHAATLPPNAGRDLGYPPAFAAVQESCCADIRPARVDGSGEAVFALARGVAEGMPAWTVTYAEPAAGVLEAVATTGIFGFHDDIVIRIRPNPDGGSRIDVRSKSRDGRGDLGANADRIRRFADAARAGLEQ